MKLEIIDSRVYFDDKDLLGPSNIDFFVIEIDGTKTIMCIVEKTTKNRELKLEANYFDFNSNEVKSAFEKELNVIRRLKNTKDDIDFFDTIPVDLY